jgi:hypothetical protein
MTLSLIAVSTGVHAIQGLFLYDYISKATHPLKPLPGIFVMAASSQ